MKGQCFFRYNLYLVIFALANLNLSKASAQDNITISTGEWPPFISKELPNYGIALHIISEAFAKVNATVEYKWYPWSRAMQEAEDENVDLSGVWIHNPVRAENFYYSDKLLDITSVFFYHKDTDFDWVDFNNFSKDVIVGVSRGHSYGSKLDAAIDEGLITIDVAPTSRLNIEKLLRKRITVFPSSKRVGKSILRNSFVKEQRSMIEFHPKPVHVSPLHIITGKGNDKGIFLIKKFNQGMRLLIESGEFNEILRQYE